jgi:hypothetical protein
MAPPSDSPALEALYDTHARGLFNFSLRTLGSRMLATQATCAALLEGDRNPDLTAIGLLASARRHAAATVGQAKRRSRSGSSPLTIREANGSLEVRHREVLALRDLLRCSYGDIALVIETGDDAVAPLLWTARLELRDLLKGSRLAWIAPLAPACARALALLTMSSDGELRDTGEHDRLRNHLRTCGKCRVSRQAAREATAAYRAWRPEPPPTGMREALLDSARLAGPTEAGEMRGRQMRNVEPTPS